LISKTPPCAIQADTGNETHFLKSDSWLTEKTVQTVSPAAKDQRVDERMVKFKGNSKMRQTMKSEFLRSGFKLRLSELQEPV
jgi:hypothetical protein